MKKLFLLLVLVSALSQACVVERFKLYSIDTVKNNPKKTCFIAGVTTAVVSKLVIPKTIDISKRVYNWIKVKLGR